MVNTAKPEPDRSGRIVKLVIFAALLILVGLPLAIWAALEPLLGPVLFPPPWKREFDQGKQLWHANRDAAEAQIKKALADASQGPIQQQMEMRRSYAELLNKERDYEACDQQLNQAIDLVKDPSKANSFESDQLTHAYQDLAFDQHYRYLENRQLPPGDKAQEMSVDVAVKAFGPNSNQATYKLAGLGSIYGDMHESDKAKAAFDRALGAVKADKNAAEASWYVYAMIARSEAVQHHYSNAIDAYLQSIHSPTPHEKYWRAWSEFTSALEAQEKDANPALEKAASMLSKGEFKQLDDLADGFRKSKDGQPSGAWVLDTFYKNVTGDNNSNVGEAILSQRIFDLKKWLKQNPKSSTARVALAQCYTQYAWEARGGGYSDSVTKDGWRLFSDRLGEAKKILDADPAIKERCPRAFFVYGRVALGEGTGKEYLQKLVDECHQKWPTYRFLDLLGCYFLLPRWYGEEHEWVQFARKQADRLVGADGDALYAQMVNYNRQFFDQIFRDEPSLDWERTKRGCKHIIATYPEDMRGRLMFFNFGAIKGDDDAMKEAFAGMQTAEK